MKWYKNSNANIRTEKEKPQFQLLREQRRKGPKLVSAIKHMIKFWKLHDYAFRDINKIDLPKKYSLTVNISLCGKLRLIGHFKHIFNHRKNYWLETLMEEEFFWKNKDILLEKNNITHKRGFSYFLKIAEDLH